MWVVILVLIALFAQLVAPDYASFKPCADGNTVLNLEITKCNQRQINGWPTCIIKHGVPVHVRAYFFSIINTFKPELITTGTFDGVEIVLPDSDIDPCKGSLHPGCPIHEGGVYEFDRYYEVPKTFPVGPVEIQSGIRDSRTRKYAGCARVPVLIERNPKLAYDF